MQSKNSSISSKEFIKKHCEIKCKWEHDKDRWVVQIKHIADKNAFSGVKVTVQGFDSFRDACDEAVKLFKHNLRNNKKDQQTMLVEYREEDIWPGIII